MPKKAARVACSSSERDCRSCASFDTCEGKTLSINSRPCSVNSTRMPRRSSGSGMRFSRSFSASRSTVWSSFPMSPSSSERVRSVKAGTALPHGAGSSAHQSSSGSGRIVQRQASANRSATMSNIHELRLARTVDDLDEALHFYHHALDLPIVGQWSTSEVGASSWPSARQRSN